MEATDKTDAFFFWTNPTGNSIEQKEMSLSVNYLMYPFNEEESNHLLFMTTKRKKHHTKYSVDNILCKIKVFFINSLLSYINQLIKIYFSYSKFRIRKIQNSLVSNKDKRATRIFFNTKLSAYFQQPISAKYTSTNPSQNKINVERLINNYPLFRSLFDLQLIQIFKHCFIQGNDIGELLCLDSLDDKTKDKIKDKKTEIKMKTLKDFEQLLLSRKYDEKYINTIKDYSSRIPQEFK